MILRFSKMVVILFLLFFLFLEGRGEAQQHRVFDDVLAAHVKGTRVDYKNLCKDERFPRYLDQLKKTDPEKIGNINDQLAFWINTYNAFTLKAVCGKYPIDSMNDLNFGGLLISVALKKTVWDRRFIEINGKKLSLKEIEHEIIRPRFKEPRSHLALSCGAISCPPLSPDVYEGITLDQQLDEQARLFFNEPFYNTFDPQTKEARLSVILDWNRRYFAEQEEGVLLFAAKFTPYDIEDPGEWKIEYNDYSLELNDVEN